MSKSKVVYILRAIPGSGKTTVAEHIKEINKDDTVICCADDYFMDKEGNYNWDAEKIGNAHGYCKYTFGKALEKEVPVVIVANTSTATKDVKFYRNLAIEAGYTVFVVTIENWHNGKDVHNVPDEVKLRMKAQLMNTIRLVPAAHTCTCCGSLQVDNVESCDNCS